MVVNPGVRVQDLSIRFGGHTVIQGLDLDVHEGEFLVLLGPSGCGKSTLLHGIAGLVEVDEGRIEIGGRDLSDAEPSQRGIGMVFQSYALYPTMTVEGNLSFGLRVAGLPREAIRERVQRAAQMLQLGSLLQRKPAQLSGGQRQRVAIGRALVRDARVFLLDEPLSNLDAQLRAELRRELKLLHQRLGATMIYVTHDQVEATTLATRLAVMRDGQIQQLGTPAEVYARPASRFVAGFVGSPAMNFIEGRLVAGPAAPRFVSPQLVLDLAGVPLGAQATPDRAVVLGVRPEHVHLAHAGNGGADLKATLQLVEPLGSQQLLWVQREELQLSLLSSEPRAWQPGEALALSFDRARISLFDRHTEARI